MVPMVALSRYLGLLFVGTLVAITLGAPTIRQAAEEELVAVPISAASVASDPSSVEGVDKPFVSFTPLACLAPFPSPEAQGASMASPLPTLTGLPETIILRAPDAVTLTPRATVSPSNTPSVEPSPEPSSAPTPIVSPDADVEDKEMEFNESDDEDLPSAKDIKEEEAGASASSREDEDQDKKKSPTPTPSKKEDSDTDADKKDNEEEDSKAKDADDEEEDSKAKESDDKEEDSKDKDADDEKEDSKEKDSDDEEKESKEKDSDGVDTDKEVSPSPTSAKPAFYVTVDSPPATNKEISYLMVSEPPIKPIADVEITLPQAIPIPSKSPAQAIPIPSSKPFESATPLKSFDATVVKVNLLPTASSQPSMASDAKDPRDDSNTQGGIPTSTAQASMSPAAAIPFPSEKPRNKSEPILTLYIDLRIQKKEPFATISAIPSIKGWPSITPETISGAESVEDMIISDVVIEPTPSGDLDGISSSAGVNEDVPAATDEADDAGLITSTPVFDDMDLEESAMPLPTTSVLPQASMSPVPALLEALVFGGTPNPDSKVKNGLTGTLASTSPLVSMKPLKWRVAPSAPATLTPQASPVEKKASSGNFGTKKSKSVSPLPTASMIFNTDEDQALTEPVTVAFKDEASPSPSNSKLPESKAPLPTASQLFETDADQELTEPLTVGVEEEVSMAPVADLPVPSEAPVVKVASSSKSDNVPTPTPPTTLSPFGVLSGDVLEASPEDGLSVSETGNPEPLSEDPTTSEDPMTSEDPTATEIAIEGSFAPLDIDEPTFAFESISPLPQADFASVSPEAQVTQITLKLPDSSSSDASASKISGSSDSTVMPLSTASAMAIPLSATLTPLAESSAASSSPSPSNTISPSPSSTISPPVAASISPLTTASAAAVSPMATSTAGVSPTVMGMTLPSDNSVPYSPMSTAVALGITAMPTFTSDPKTSSTSPIPSITATIFVKGTTEVPTTSPLTTASDAGVSPIPTSTAMAGTPIPTSTAMSTSIPTSTAMGSTPIATSTAMGVTPVPTSTAVGVTPSSTPTPTASPSLSPFPSFQLDIGSNDFLTATDSETPTTATDSPGPSVSASVSADPVLVPPTSTPAVSFSPSTTALPSAGVPVINV